MSIWSDALKRLADLAEAFLLMKDTQKTQGQEISLLRQENAELRRENARIGERLATLEEGRKAVAADVKTALIETLWIWKIQQKDEGIAALKRNRLTDKAED